MTFESGQERSFDLVVGADGLHSASANWRSALRAGGSTIWAEVAAFEVERLRPREELYVMYTEVGQQVGRFALRDDRTMFHLPIRPPARAINEGA